MIELGELERHHDEFAKRNTRVVVVSLEDQDEAKKTQTDFPHLIVVADAEHKLISAIEVLHTASGNRGQDTAAPTTIYIDKNGIVRSVFRPGQIVIRLPAKDVL